MKTVRKKQDAGFFFPGVGETLGYTEYTEQQCHVPEVKLLSFTFT